MTALRTYCKHDPIMVSKLLWMLQYLKEQPAAQDNYKACIQNEIITLEQAKKTFDSEMDIQMLDKQISNN